MKPIINYGVTAQEFCHRMEIFAQLIRGVRIGVNLSEELSAIETKAVINCINCGSNSITCGQCDYCRTKYYSSGSGIPGPPSENVIS